MAVSMSSRPSASPGPSVTLRRSPRFDPYKASTAQRAQQRATPRSLKGTLDPATFAAVPPVIAQKRKRKTSPTTTTTSVDRAPRTHTATRGPSSSRKENEAKAAQIAFQCSLKKSSKPTTLVDDAQPRVITKSGTARKHLCIAKDAALRQDDELSTGRSLRPRRRVAGSVIAQTCKTTAASLYRSIVTSILPNSSSKSRKARKAPVSLPVASTSAAPEPPVALTTSAPTNLSNDSARSSDSSSPNDASSAPDIGVLKHPTPPSPSTALSILSSTPDGLSQTPHRLTTVPMDLSAQATLSMPHTDNLASPHVEGAEPSSPYQDVVAVPTSPLSSYPTPSTFDTVDMGATAVSDLQSSPSIDDFRLPPSGFVEPASASTVDDVVVDPVPAEASYVVATPQFTPASYPYSSYTIGSPASDMYAGSPSSQFVGTSGFSGTVINDAMSVDEVNQPSRQTEEAMDVSMDSADAAPASESDLGFGFVPQEQVQMQPIQLPEISFIVPPPPAPPAEDYVSPTSWPRHAKLTVEWNMFSKSQQWHECLARIHDELLAAPHPVHRKEGNNLKRWRVVPEVKPMHEVGHQMNDRSLFVSMSRGRVLEISRRMGADTIRDIVADEAWRYFKRTGVFPPSYARAHLANSSPASAAPQTQIQLPQASLESSDMDSRSDEDAIIDFMSEEIYDFELEDEDAMDEDDDLSEDERFDPRLPSRFCVYFPEEEEDDSPPAPSDNMPVEADQMVADEDTDDDSSCSDDSEDSDDDMELIASTGDAEGCGCNMMQLDLQLPAQEPTSPASLAPKEDLFHVPIGQQVIFAWGDPPQLPTPTNPVPPRPMNISPFSVPMNIPSFASIRLRSLTAVDSFSCDQLPLRGTKADKVVGYCWSPAPFCVQTPELVEHHTRTGSVAVRPPRVYRHAIIKPPEVIKSFLKVAFAEVAQRSLTRKQSTVDLDRLRPPLMLDNSSADQPLVPVSLPSTSTVADMSWMAMDESQPQQSMDASPQNGMSYQASSILEAAYTQVTGTFQPDNVWYDFPPVHHTPTPQMFIQSSSLSNALG